MPPRTSVHTNGPAIRARRLEVGLGVNAVVTRLAGLGVQAHPNHLRNIETGARKGTRPELVNALAKVLKTSRKAILAPTATDREPANVH